MSNITKWIQIVAFSSGLGLVAVRGASPETPSSVDLSGTWVLNEALSDDPRDVMQKRMEAGRRGGYGRGGHGGPPGGPPPDGGNGGDRQRTRERLAQLETPRRIVILQDNDRITMIPEGRDTVSVVPDGETHTVKTVMGNAEVQAKWKDLALEIRTKGPEGREFVRWYRINADGRLEVVTTLQLPRDKEKVEIVLRYDEGK